MTGAPSNPDDLFLSVLQLSPVGFGMVDAEGVLLLCNPALARMLGYGVEEMIGVSFERFTHPDDLLLEWPLIDKIWSGESDHYEIEKRYIRKDGEIIWVHVVGSISMQPRKEDGFGFAFVQDITKRKALEAEIEAQRKQLRQTLDATTDGIWTWNFQTEELFFSPRYYTMLGYEPNAFPPGFASWKDLLHPDDLDPALRTAEAYLKTKPDTYVNTFRLRSRSGDYRWIRAKARVVERDEQGEALFMIGNHEDITEQKQVEEELRLYEIMVSSASEPMAVIDRTYTFLLVNPSYEHFWGVAKEELLGRRVPDLLGEEVFENTVKDKADRCLAGETVRYSAWFPSPTQGPRYMNLNYYPFRIGEGPILGLINIAYDATDLKEAEEALREAALRQDAAVRAANVGLWDWDLVTNRVFYSSEWKRQIGYEDHEIGDGFEEWRSRVHPDDLDATLDGVMTAIAEARNSYQVEFRFRHKDGSYRWILAQASVIKDETGRPVRTLGSHVDITERKRNEEHLVQSQKMEAIGTLASGVAHDFNNILSAIVGFTEMVAEELPQGARNRADLDEVLKAAGRARNLVKQILAFGRRGEDRAARPLRAQYVVKEALKMLRSSLPTSIEIKQSVPADLPAVVADPTRLHQVMMNLCTNAAQAMAEEKGTLTVILDEVRFEEEESLSTDVIRPGPYVRLRVSDTGKGMPDEVLDQIFHPYYTTKQPGEGTGLGLSVVYGIVKEYGGGISVKSRVGEGSTFTLLFPATSDEEPERRASSPLQSEGKGERVLFVDDEEPIVKLGRKTLERLGYRVDTTRDPLEALEWFREDPHRFDVVITDMTMPRMTGDELAREVLALRPETPVILCTGYSKRMTEEKARQMGIRAFVMKPLSQRELGLACRRVLDERSP